jgi:mannobiose 2-epimerase
MVGFFNTWQITGDDHYLQQSLKSWDFVKKYILHKEKGEWYWGVTDTYDFMHGQDKVGLWKCPYHNSRACVEIIKRVSTIQQGKLHTGNAFTDAG